MSDVRLRVPRFAGCGALLLSLEWAMATAFRDAPRDGTYERPMLEAVTNLQWKQDEAVMSGIHSMSRREVRISTMVFRDDRNRLLPSTR